MPKSSARIKAALWLALLSALPAVSQSGTATAPQLNATIQQLSGCSTSTNVYTPGAASCVPATGTGTVTDGAGTSAAGYVPISTVTTHQLGYDTNLDDGATTANTLTYAGSGGIAATGGSVSVILGTAVAPQTAPSSGKYKLYVNSSTGQIQCDYGTTPTACLPSYSYAQASLTGSNLTMSSTSTFYDGPTTGSLAAGTYFVTSTLTIGKASATTQATVICKLWDGATVFASSQAELSYVASAAITYASVTLSAVVTEASTATIKVSCEPQTTNEIMYYQTATGTLANASSISAVRLK